MKSLTGQCPICRENRNATVVAESEEVFESADEPALEGSAYRILKCAGCDTRNYTASRNDLLAYTFCWMETRLVRTFR
jgi:hypothetical protein